MNCECPQDVIIITQGDDSNAIGGNIVLELDTDLDLKGWTARFQIGEQVWDFDDITSKELNLVITKEQSAQTRLLCPLFVILSLFFLLEE